MLANQTSRPTTTWRRLWLDVSASPEANGPVATTLRVLLALLWFPFVIYSGVGLAALGSRLASGSAQATNYLNATSALGELNDWEYIGVEFSVAILVGFVVGILAFLPFFVVARRSVDKLAFFARCWWRACLWETLWLIPFGVLYGFYAEDAPLYDLVIGMGPLVGLAFLIFAPAFLARAEIRAARLPLSRWRPACPECGYSLQRLTQPRCPECGAALPIAGRTFRRWAHRRLLWDRVQRGNALIAYPITLLTILVCPCRAGRAVALPDRYGRALRWAMFHIALTAAVAILVKYHTEVWLLVDALLNDVRLKGLAPYSEYFSLTSIADIRCWLAWTCALMVIPLVGCGLAFAAFNRHPAARRTMFKWSLYACAAIPFARLAMFALSFLPGLGNTPSSMQPMPFSLLHIIPPPMAPLTPFVAAYALYWASGIAHNAYLPRRGAGVFLKHLALYAGAWLLLTYALYPLGPLKYML